MTFPCLQTIVEVLKASVEIWKGVELSEQAGSMVENGVEHQVIQIKSYRAEIWYRDTERVLDEDLAIY